MTAGGWDAAAGVGAVAGVSRRCVARQKTKVKGRWLLWKRGKGL